MVETAVTSITTAIALLDTLCCHRATEFSSAARTEFDTFDPDTPVELSTTCHMQMTTCVVNYGSAVFIIGSIGLVNIRARYCL